MSITSLHLHINNHLIGANYLVPIESCAFPHYPCGILGHPPGALMPGNGTVAGLSKPAKKRRKG